jgi:hypothetical protein
MMWTSRLRSGSACSSITGSTTSSAPEPEEVHEASGGEGGFWRGALNEGREGARRPGGTAPEGGRGWRRGAREGHAHEGRFGWVRRCTGEAAPMEGVSKTAVK